MEARKRIIVAVDVDSVDAAMHLIHQLKDSVGIYKIGLEALTAMGPSLFGEILREYTNARFMYDAKFNDIPNTVAGAVRAATRVPGLEFVTVHLSAGRAAVRAAVDAAEDKIKILGITALTSLDHADCCQIYNSPRRETVGRLLHIAEDEKVHGIVCSPVELKMVRGQVGMIKVVPGIRPDWAVSGDQKNIATPSQAVKDGADYLVVGRPIREPPVAVGGPLAAATSIAMEIERAEAADRVEK